MIKLYYNPKMLKNFIFLILSLQVTKAAITDFWNNDIIDQSTLDCLQQSGYLDQVFVLGTYNSAKNLWKTNVPLEQINKMGIIPQVVISTSEIEGRLPPQLQAHRIYRQFENSPILKYWVRVSEFKGAFRPTCDYLRTLALYLQLYSKTKVGIQTELLFWEETMGNRMACPELATHDLFLSFNNFKPFGGWKSYSYFETYQYVNVCGYPGMEVFKK